MTPIVSLRGIRKSFGAVEVLHGVDFEVRPGEVHVLAGENGAGKRPSSDVPPEPAGSSLVRRPVRRSLLQAVTGRAANAPSGARPHDPRVGWGRPIGSQQSVGRTADANAIDDIAPPRPERLRARL